MKPETKIEIEEKLTAATRLIQEAFALLKEQNKSDPKIEKTHGDSIILTKEMLHACFTDAGGMTNATLNALGLKKPLIAGWPAKLIGQPISEESYDKAVEGRWVYRQKMNG